MMSILKKILNNTKNLFYDRFLPLFLSAKNLKAVCPICGWQGREFLPTGVVRRLNAACPRCGSLERHRLYYLFLSSAIPKDKKLKVIHFAPEPIIAAFFKSYPNITYLSADLDEARAMIKADLTDLPFPNDNFDIIFCSHVLEHIPDEKKALSELKRVLKPGGFAILQVPIKDEFNGRRITETFEDASVTEPAERLKIFGQSDHVRIYGRDYPSRLEQAGWNVKIIKFADSLGENDLKKYAVLPNDESCTETEGWIFYCTK